MNSVKVFVYGTLKPGEINYDRYCVGKVVEEKPAIAYGQLYHLSLGYPGLILGEGQVQGFLLTFTDSTIFDSLDELEDYDPNRRPEDNEYNREQIEVYGLAGQLLGLAWVYFMTLEKVQYFQGTLIPSGCWTSAAQQR
ncbi:gamma-glutamylcyclotransferase family protein [Allocoleopsis sp.]|uniref:gamma-glutamylcyclotransferase family protein n=1 Tax=Allocoleopsis sp. TaxID=3088169 RepID=UPI002FD4F314